MRSMQRRGSCGKQVRPIINSVSMLRTCKLPVVLSVFLLALKHDLRWRSISTRLCEFDQQSQHKFFARLVVFPHILFHQLYSLDMNCCCKSKSSDFLIVVFERVLTSKAFEENCDALEPPQTMTATPSAPSSLLNSFRLPFLFTVLLGYGQQI